MRKYLIVIAAVMAASSVHSETVQHDPTTVYALPFKSGSCVRVLMGYDDPRGHTGDRRFAILFGAPVGTEVLAARGGVVAGTGTVPHGDDPGTSRGDYVLVRHSDGTFGAYIHLRHKGAAVAKGQSVKTGQLLGYSGCFGRCDAGVLHFHVSTPMDERRSDYKTFPTVFKTGQDSVEFLEANRCYLVP
ncbi:MAG TPA: M23 family metallopeptidase [Steroidobacteraceae bacterium]|jgi:murein DD-endopeptidase MepM/ murein hydrolase activator NlpD|nr:M23 family metallopeptidase [Steroidobacteraceae bacterium]